MNIRIFTDDIFASATINEQQLSAINKIISPEPKEYRIFFAQGNDQFTEKELQYREYAGSVMAKDLHEAFAKSQNSNDAEWEKLGRRSTSVGDMISDGENMYMVASQGFKLVGSVLLDQTQEIIESYNHQHLHEEIQRFNEYEMEYNQQMQMEMVEDMIQHDMMSRIDDM